MRKHILMFVSVLSFSLTGEAQPNIEWIVKTGLYTELYKFPFNRNGVAGTYVEDNPYSNFSIACNFKKYSTIIQANYNLKYDQGLPIFRSSFPGYYKGSNGIVTGPTLKTTGDTIAQQAWYCNWLNVLRDMPQESKKHQFLAGLGITSRYDILQIVSYVNGASLLVDIKNYTRLMPSLHAEYMYKPFKHFFISTHLDYAYFFVAPNHYWQFAISLGSNFSFKPKSQKQQNDKT
jgi:hypothetical protein